MNANRAPESMAMQRANQISRLEECTKHIGRYVEVGGACKAETKLFSLSRYNNPLY